MSSYAIKSTNMILNPLMLVYPAKFRVKLPFSFGYSNARVSLFEPNEF
jgi:hypothetical protein